MRAGIQRYLTSAPVNRVGDNIGGLEFAAANRMLKITAAKYLNDGGKAKSYPLIERGDMKKLCSISTRARL